MRATLAVICVSALVVNVDNTILNVALPTLVRQLHATSSELQWIVDSYAMVFAGLLLVGGSLADRFGRKRFFLIGLTVFAASSIGAAFLGLGEPVDRVASADGDGRSTDHSRVVVDHQRRLPRPDRACPCHRCLGRDDRARHRDRPDRRRPAAREILVGLGVPRERPDRRRRFPGSPGARAGLEEPAADQPDPAGGLLSIAGLGLLLWAIIEAPTAGWASGEVIGVGLASLAVLRRLRRLGGPQPPPDAEAGASSRTAASR